MVLLVIIIRIQWLVGDFVALDAFQEVVHDLLSMTFGVIRTRHLHFLYTEMISYIQVVQCTTVKAPKKAESCCFTIMLAAITSGSSQTDSTKNTCAHKHLAHAIKCSSHCTFIYLLIHQCIFKDKLEMCSTPCTHSPSQNSG